jgi:hypothetical protein
MTFKKIVSTAAAPAERYADAQHFAHQARSGSSEVRKPTENLRSIQEMPPPQNRF